MSDWLGITGLLVGLVGLAAATYFYLRTRRHMQLGWFSRYALVIVSLAKLPELTILYRGEPVPNLMVTDITCWNAGNVEIEGADIPERDPIRIEASDEVKILDFEVTRMECASRDLTVTRNELRTALHVSFGFLNPGDGFSVKIFHQLSETPFSVTGTIKGVPSGNAIRKAGRDVSIAATKEVGLRLLEAAFTPVMVAGLILITVVAGISFINSGGLAVFTRGTIPLDAQPAAAWLGLMGGILALGVVSALIGWVTGRTSPLFRHIAYRVSTRIFGPPAWATDDVQPIVSSNDGPPSDSDVC